MTFVSAVVVFVAVFVMTVAWPPGSARAVARGGSPVRAGGYLTGNDPL